jgi:hypothetical protein
MSRYLFLDDDMERHRTFRRRTIGHIVDHVHTAHDCMTALLRAVEPYDVVFLDHGLDEEASAGLPPRQPTGMVVAAFIAAKLLEHRVGRPGRIVVHSQAGAYAPLMVRLLEGAGIEARWEPFGRRLLNTFGTTEGA